MSEKLQDDDLNSPKLEYQARAQIFPTKE